MSTFLLRLAAGLILVLTVAGPLTGAAHAATASTSPSCLPASVRNTLAQIRQKFGPIRIVSTFRKGARIAGTGRPSLHGSCRAVDFHPPAGKYQQVLSWLKANHQGGLGTYSCGMHHLHIDNGAKVRFNHCVTANGTPIGKSKSYAFKGKSKRKSVAARSKKSKTLVAGKLKKKSYAFRSAKKRKKKVAD